MKNTKMLKKRLIEENKILKAQNESLMQFKKNFDNFYHDISDVRIIERNYNNRVVLNGVYSIDYRNLDCPIDMCKEYIVRDMSRKLMPYVEFDIVDNEAYGTKDLVGRLLIMTK